MSIQLLDQFYNVLLQILREGIFHPNEIICVEELSDNNYDRGLDYCEALMEKCNNKLNF